MGTWRWFCACSTPTLSSMVRSSSCETLFGKRCDANGLRSYGASSSSASIQPHLHRRTSVGLPRHCRAHPGLPCWRWRSMVVKSVLRSSPNSSAAVVPGASLHRISLHQLRRVQLASSPCVHQVQLRGRAFSRTPAQAWQQRHRLRPPHHGAGEARLQQRRWRSRTIQRTSSPLCRGQDTSCQAEQTSTWRHPSGGTRHPELLKEGLLLEVFQVATRQQDLLELRRQVPP